MKKQLIESAAKKLELINITLHESNLKRGEQDPFNYSADVTQQSMLNVTSEEISYSTDGDDLNLFRSFINLGIRAIRDDSDSEVYFTVEATFRVDYMLDGTLTNEEANEFSNFNSVHNVWPFWRQYVFEVVRAAELPQLIVPLMRGINVNRKGKKKSSKKKTSKNKL